MKRFVSVSLTIVSLASVILLLVGCGGTTLGPKWFINPPEDPNYIYTTATDSSTDLQYAIDKATALARDQIANTIGTKVASLFKRFREELGEREDPEFITMTTNVSKQVVSEVVSGSKVVKKEVIQKGKLYHAYVLMQMPVGEANAALMARIKANQNLYTRFRASQAFKELAEEADKYEKFRKEQGL